jgi:hypothetical protein
MLALQVLLGVYLLLCLLYWVWQAYAMVRVARGVPRLGDPREPDAWRGTLYPSALLRAGRRIPIP